MSNDLIRKSDVLKIVEDIKVNPNAPKNYGTLLDIMRAIRKLPTAYDVDKVAEQLKDCAIEFEAFGQCSDYVELSHAIGIVKKGNKTDGD